MSETLKNTIAVITGGAKGIGYAIAEEFLNEKAKTVVIVDINENQGNHAVETLNSTYGANKAIFFKGDVLKDLDRIYNEVVQEYQNIDILVNSAGVLDEHSARRCLEINTIATIEWSMKFLENMRKDKGGQGGTILNLASIYGYLVDEQAPFYKASKYAVMGFTKTLGHVKNYEVTGVRVMALCPGVTNTDIIQNVTQNKALEFQKVQLKDFLSTAPNQEKEVVGKAAVTFLAKGQSGSAWSIIADELQPVDA